MQQRSEPHDSLDDFPTPPWAGRALIEHVLLSPQLGNLRCDALDRLWEPAVNRGFLLRGLRSYFVAAYGSDICNYETPYAVADFLFPGTEQYAELALGDFPDWIITNPPFRLAGQFIERCRELTRLKGGYAMLVRTSFLEGVGRYKTIFQYQPPTVIAQFSERVPMVKGRCDPAASTATSYCWLVWLRAARPRQAPLFVWIPPCRKALEREGDYA